LIAIMTVPISNPANSSPKGVYAIGNGPPVYKYPINIQQAPMAAIHHLVEAAMYTTSKIAIPKNKNTSVSIFGGDTPSLTIEPTIPTESSLSNPLLTL